MVSQKRAQVEVALAGDNRVVVRCPGEPKSAKMA